MRKESTLLGFNAGTSSDTELDCISFQPACLPRQLAHRFATLFGFEKTFFLPWLSIWCPEQLGLSPFHIEICPPIPPQRYHNSPKLSHEAHLFMQSHFGRDHIHVPSHLYQDSSVNAKDTRREKGHIEVKGRYHGRTGSQGHPSAGTRQR